MKKLILFVFAVFLVIPLITDAAPRCNRNATPNLQQGDAACYTSHTTTRNWSTYERTGRHFVSNGCRWYVDCRNCSYPCNNSRGGACRATFYTNTCGGRWCSNMGSPPEQGRWVDDYGWIPHSSSSTSYYCYYTTVNSWSDCSATGIQSATSVTQHRTNGSNCQNRNEATTRMCGVCDPATNGKGSGDAPTGNLCLVGNAHPVPPTLNTTTNRWEWSCLGADGNSHADDAVCSAPRDEDGACSTTAGGEYTWDETDFRGEVCSGGTVTLPAPGFPAYSKTVSWGCNHIGVGVSTTSDACSANRLPPNPGRCGPDHEKVFKNGPLTKSCYNPDTVANVVDNSFRQSPVQYDTDAGKWTWKCDGSKDGIDRSVPCEADCIPEVSIDISPNPFPLPKNGTEVDLQITMHIDGACSSLYECTVNGEPIENSKTETITVDISDTTLHVECPGIDFDNPGTPGDPNNPPGDPNNSNNQLSGYCVQKDCNAQGTCQATPRSANNINQCSSTCNSNADCSSGRMIETRP